MKYFIVSCDMVDFSSACPVLTDPENGDVDISGFFPGAEATYECDNGYILVGVDTRNCGENGQWSGDKPSCEIGKNRCLVLNHMTAYTRFPRWLNMSTYWELKMAYGNLQL